MKKRETLEIDPAERIRTYLQKIATGPRMSKDLTEEEANDALTLILNGSVSPVRAGIFLIAARMKLETVEENIGYWRALDQTTVKHPVSFDELLQVADPFDGFNRVPYFGFYAVPVIAGMGLPTYGHSTLPLPPKLGITFEEILTRHYRVPVEGSGEKRRFLFNEFGFGYLSTVHSNPALERLREMRHEIVKRPMLATVEKMLMPLQCKTGKNYLATGYFHKGYETAMMAIARLSDFDRTLVGNGMEGTTLYGVHKSSRVFIDTGQGAPREVTVDAAGAFSPPTASRIQGTYEELKKEKSSLDFIGEWGEAALKENRGPAAPLIACQAGLLCHLLGKAPTAQDGFDTASETLKKGKAYDRLMRYIEKNH